MLKKDYLKELNEKDMKELPVILRKMEADYEEVQESVLLHILENAKDSEIGKKYGFAEIHSSKEYRSRVPVSEFKDYEDAISRMKKGEEDILFPGKARSFVVTSGTTGISKYIPESATGALAKSLVEKFRTVELVRMEPKIMAPGYHILTITNSSEYGKTEGGIPAGSASGQAAEGGVLKQKMTIPIELLTAKGLTNDSSDYLTVLFAAADKDVAFLAINNLVQFNRLIHLLNAEAGKVLKDFENGTLSVLLPEEEKSRLTELWKAKATQERAQELKAIYEEKGRFTVEDLWPKFAAIACWTSGSVGRCLKELKGLFPADTEFIEWGYGASEGKFNIPAIKGISAGYPGIFALFFEFLPLDGGEPVLLKDTEPGTQYELVITNYSGFYRYNMHDIVEVKRDSNGLPLLEFLCKSKDCVEMDGARLYSYELLQMADAYENAHNMIFTLIQGQKTDSGLQILVECMDEDTDLSDFEPFMKKELKMRKMRLAEVAQMKKGYRDSLFTKVLDSGKSVVSTKLPVFID